MICSLCKYINYLLFNYLYVGTHNLRTCVYIFKNQFWMTEVVTACIGFI